VVVFRYMIYKYILL